MKKNVFLLLISVICLTVGTWTIVGLYKSLNKPKAQNIDLSQLDLSKIELNIEGQDLTKPYIDSVHTKRPEQVNFSITRDGNRDKINQLNALFINSKELFHEIGAPNRIKSVVKNFPSYVFDNLGFYIKTDSTNRVISYSIYFQKGTLDVAPTRSYNGVLTIDGMEIKPNWSKEQYIEQLGLQEYLAPNNYLLKGTEKNIIFSFHSSDSSLVNILVEEK